MSNRLEEISTTSVHGPPLMPELSMEKEGLCTELNRVVFLFGHSSFVENDV